MANPDPSDKQASWHIGDPFWRSTRMVCESLFFVRESSGAPPTARLLLPPATPPEITSASWETGYASPGDYLVDSDTGILTLPPGSRIPFMDRADLYPMVGQEHAMAFKRGDERVGLYFGEGHLFHDRQAVASYDYQVPWRGFVPAAQPDRLPGTMRRLASSLPLRICLMGDSISTGSNASALTKVPPWIPPYTELWVDTMRRRRAGEVILENYAVSGTGMKYGVAVAGKVMDEAPDLVVIAYGMNDAGFITVDEYVSLTTRILDVVRGRNPETEIILVSSTLGNPEWNYAPTEKFLLFRDALESLCGTGVALADLTSLWADMLKVKSYHDLTGNGVNHPNDFGHRIHAQVLLELLGFGAAGG